MPNVDFSPRLMRFPTLDSTNRKARELAQAGASEGTVVVAEAQTAGRGSGKRTWASPRGGLYASFLLFPREAKRATDLSILAGAAVAQAVTECLPKSFAVSVKWPNDCLVNWKKVGGILCETLGEEFFHLCVVGIGINVNLSAAELRPFLDNPFSATSFKIEAGGGEASFDVERTLETLQLKLFNLYRIYHQEGFAPVRETWERNCHLIGHKVELRESGWREEETLPGHGVTCGTLVGIDESGGLVLSNAKGERRSYYSGEITCYW